MCHAVEANAKRKRMLLPAGFWCVELLCTDLLQLARTRAIGLVLCLLDCSISMQETQAIDAYNDAHHYRAENPLAHLHEVGHVIPPSP
eukprot:3689999-Amphidinium_carterae.1